jgi:hypothetical protein
MLKGPDMASLSHVLRVTTLAAMLAGCSSLYAATSQPTAITPDGGRYFGSLLHGKLHGRGTLEWQNGDRYVGGFAGGTFAGEGELTYADGRKYRGNFVRGEFQGKGRYEKENQVYDGDFEKNEFTGNGVFTTKEGTRHEGRFLKWRAHGAGRFKDANGNIYEGNFADGDLVGTGRLRGTEVGSYEGEFKQWRFHGQGVLHLPNGDVYRGQFNYGIYDGQGTLTYAKAQPDGSTEASGVWRYGRLVDERAERQAQENVEAALYNQRALLDKALASLVRRDPGKINLYFLAIGGDGSQEVFRREVEFVRTQFDREFGTTGRSLALINSRSTVRSVPMATVTSIRESLKAIAARMDKETDILFLFLTSHGSKEHEFTLNQESMELRGLRASELGKLLKETGIRWKVVVVSACYSGGFIDPVKDDHTLVITAARHDRSSFGCADENDFTYFGRAFFKDALPSSSSFQDAFRKAEVLIREREAADQKAGSGTTEENHSFPQLQESPAVAQYLQRWWSQAMPAGRTTASTAEAR